MGKTTKIALSISAVNPTNSTWIRAEIVEKEVGERESVKAVFEEALQEVNEILQDKFKDFVVDLPTIPNKVEEIPTFQSQEQQYEYLISNASTLNELKMYEKLANNPKYPTLKEAYNNKLKSFQ